MCKTIVTKKRLTIFMTLGLVPLLVCFVALFLYGFLIVKEILIDVINANLLILIPPCLLNVFYVLFLGCFYLDLLFKNNKSLIISALHILGLLFHMAVGASLQYAITFDEYKVFHIAGAVMTGGLVLIVLCGAIGFSLWPLTLSREDSFSTVGCDVKMRKLIAKFKSKPIIGSGSILSFGVIAYLVYISGVITYTVELADDDYVTPELYSFEFVPLYIIVGVFPVLLVSTLIYNIWEKKAAGYLITPTSCLLSVVIGFCLLNHAFIDEHVCTRAYFHPLYCRGSAIVVAALSLMMLVNFVLLLLWSHLLLFSSMYRTVNQTSIDEGEMPLYGTYENMALNDDEWPSSDVKPVEIDL